MLSIIQTKQVIFKLIRNLSKIYSETSYRVESINKHNNSAEYSITFFYPGRRQLFVKSAIEVFENDPLIIKFTSLDAAEIGLYAAISHQNKYNKIRGS